MNHNLLLPSPAVHVECQTTSRAYMYTQMGPGIIENGIGNGLIFIAFHTSILVIPDINIIDS